MAKITAASVYSCKTADHGDETTIQVRELWADMKRFKSILVGVDLADGDRLVSESISAPSEEAVVKAIWLAKTNSAHLTFFHVLPSGASNLDAKTQMLLEDGHDKRTVRDHAKEVVAKMVQQARDQGIEADNRVVFGKSWVETIRQVIRKDHDLVIVGGRDSRPGRPFFAGSTAIKLLRKCPCAVWVTKPNPDRTIGSILVAHDLRPVGDLAMELGCSLAQLHGSELHVVHAAEYPEYDNMFPSRISADSAAKYRRNAEQHIANQLAKFDLRHESHVHFTKRAPDLAILEQIERHSIELLVMGTIGRTGITGLVTGNTAERLLPLVQCSILAVKPAGFQSPITLENQR